jgi:hypothetical protein
VSLVLAISFSHEHFSELRRFWQQVRPAPGESARPLGTSRREDLRWGGKVQLIGWENHEVLASADLPLATGLARDGDTLLACSYRMIARYDLGLQQLEVLSDPLFCNLHSISPHPDGWLVSSTGIDAIVKWQPGRPGNVWWSAEIAGYTHTPSGVRRMIDYGLDHRRLFYPTQAQTTHVNGALSLDPADAALLTLFHQGLVVRTDGVKTTTVVAGLQAPHSPRRRVGNIYYCADSHNGRIVEWDGERQRQIALRAFCPWVQDAMWLEGRSTYLVADSNNYRIVEVTLGGAIVDEFRFADDWRIHEITVLEDV